MSYEVVDDIPQCEWEGCYARGMTRVFTEDGTQSMLVCPFHRRVALMNLEQFGTLRMPASARRGESTVRPGSPPPKQSVPTARPGGDEQPEWVREAARKADDAAVPLDPTEFDDVPEKNVVAPIISDIPKPRLPS